MRESPAPTCEPSSQPRTEFVAPSTLAQAPRSTPSAPVPRIRSRREAQRLLEEEQYLREEVEEGELDEDQDELEGIHEASGLDTSPEWELSTSRASPPQGIAPYHMVMRKATELLDLQLPTAEYKPNILTEVLHSPSAVVEPLLPFNDALTEPIMEVWRKPLPSPAVSKVVARRYRTAPRNPAFLSSHPSPESLVVQASCSKQSSGAFPQTPADRDSKKMEQSAKKIFSSSSMALKSTNTICLLGRYLHALMDSAKHLAPKLPEEERDNFMEVLTDAQAASKQVIQSGLDTADSVARIMGSSIASRRQAWLRSSNFSPDVQATLVDLPFDGSRLFGEKADSALQRFKDS